MEELLKFTLSSHIDETLDFDLGISSKFCTNPLQDDPNDAVSPSTSFDFDSDEYSLQGVPLHPLDKRLALALCRSVNCGAFCRTYKKVALMNEECFLEQKEEEWSQLILNKGSSDLVDILKAVEFELHVQEPFFSFIKDGLKTVEGRCAISDYNSIGPGSVILLNKCMMLKVQSVCHYDSFSEMLEAESLVKVLPGVKTIEEGVQIYRKFYTEEKERSNGVLAICISKMATQPYVTLASILSGLGYVGIQSLLGLSHTAGTISDALPPPRSALLSSFMLPFKPNPLLNVDLPPPDSNKNRLAMDVIGPLIAYCCWLNVHIVQPHGIVFEIRVADGYGARWSEDGSKKIVQLCAVVHQIVWECVRVKLPLGVGPTALEVDTHPVAHLRCTPDQLP
ncbi:ASCH domain-containing protein [Citrus sinensis]|uniref:ASCH domain-containing protein n=1 Tax=Citrus sinensis TaxID=2711 RepID=A0ACB8MCU1_CITSI|nr:ASCH domain-containing protein [Citrus sinensis]